MRSEHRTTAAEFDMRSGLPYCYLRRPGVKKWIKTNSHRLDRRRVGRIIREQMEG